MKVKINNTQPKGQKTNGFLKELGIMKINSLEFELEKTWGKEKSEKILDRWGELQAEIESVEEEKDLFKIYDFLNEDYETSIAVTNYNDADIIKMFCNWIESNSKYFNDNILDVGCGTGIITCFIAKIFQDKKITGIDKSEKSIAIANVIKEKFGLENVEFITTDIEEYNSKKFNTVISMRTLAENRTGKFESYHYLPFSKQLEVCESATTNYLSKLSNLVEDNGNLLIIERMIFDTNVLAVMNNIVAKGFTIVEETISEFQCNEANKVNGNYITFFANKGESDTKESTFDKWKKNGFKNESSPSYADYTVEKNAGKLITGYKTFDKEGKQSIICSLYEDKDNKDEFWMYRKSNFKAEINKYGNDRLEEAKNIFEECKKDELDNGSKIEEI